MSLLSVSLGHSFAVVVILGKELTQAVVKLCIAAKSTLQTPTLPKAEYSALIQEYYCAAYSALCAVVMNTQSQEKFYQGFLFKVSKVYPYFILFYFIILLFYFIIYWFFRMRLSGKMLLILLPGTPSRWSLTTSSSRKRWPEFDPISPLETAPGPPASSISRSSTLVCALRFFL